MIVKLNTLELELLLNTYCYIRIKYIFFIIILKGISQMIEHLQYVPLINGIMAELSLKGILSLDIAGQIEMSLWNKNAQSVIEKK